MDNVLESDVIKLRALEPYDADLLYIWENDPSIWQVGETIVPFSHKVIQEYIANASLDIYESKQLRLMVDAKINNTLVTVGSIDLFDFNPFHQRVGIGILIYKMEHRHQGYASEALRLILEYCFNVLQLYLVYCNVTSNNLNSLDLFQKLGFQIVANKPKWTRIGDKRHNEYTLQIINSK